MLDRITKLLGMALVAATMMHASIFNFSGTFASDDQVQLFSFSISSSRTVTILGLSYGGGTSAAPGNPVYSPGGFDNLLTIFQADGTEVGSFDDDSSCTHTTAGPGGCLDSYFSNTLATGSYILALTQSSNLPNGDLADGFSQAGNGDYTAGNCSPAHPFCDFEGNPRNGNWAIDIKTVDNASEAGLPEPLSIALGASGLAFIGFVRRRRTPASV